MLIASNLWELLIKWNIYITLRVLQLFRAFIHWWIRQLYSSIWWSLRGFERNYELDLQPNRRFQLNGIWSNWNLSINDGLWWVYELDIKLNPERNRYRLGWNGDHKNWLLTAFVLQWIGLRWVRIKLCGMFGGWEMFAMWSWINYLHLWRTVKMFIVQLISIPIIFEFKIIWIR